MKKSLLFAVITAAIFSSCTTMSDISINSGRTQFDENIEKIENAVVPLEAQGLRQPAPVKLKLQLPAS